MLGLNSGESTANERTWAREVRRGRALHNLESVMCSKHLQTVYNTSAPRLTTQATLLQTMSNMLDCRVQPSVSAYKTLFLHGKRIA